jgi:hypothetical protein
MDDAEANETRVLPDATRTRESLSTTFDPSRPIRLFVGRSLRSTRANSEIGFVKEMDDLGEPTSICSPDKYGYLEHLLTFKDKCKPNDKSLKKQVR